MNPLPTDDNAVQWKNRQGIVLNINMSVHQDEEKTGGALWRLEVKLQVQEKPKI